MKHSGFRRWMWLGGAASAVVLSVGCGELARSGGGSNQELPQMNFFGGLANSEQGADLSRFHVSADRGYNGTIADLGSSIDPRTPEKEGTPGRTRLTDITGYMGRQDIAQNYPFPPTSLGIGGSGPVDPMSGTQEPAWRTWPGSVPASSQGEGGQSSGGQQQFAPAGSGTE